MSSSGLRRKSLYGYQLANSNQEQIFRASPGGHAAGGATCFRTFLSRPPPVFTSGCAGGAVSSEASVPERAGPVPGRCSSDSGANRPTDEGRKLRALKNVEVLGLVVDSGRFMNDCALLALPGFIRDGVPLKVIEAMARGQS
jgi:hypothetical protein